MHFLPDELGAVATKRHFISFGASPQYLSDAPCYFFNEPLCIVSVRNSRVSVHDCYGERISSKSWDQELRDSILTPLERLKGSALAHVPFCAGFFCYELLHTLEQVPLPSVDPFNLPDLSLALYRTVFRSSFQGNAVHTERFSLPEEIQALRAPLWYLEDSKSTSPWNPVHPHASPQTELSSNFGPREYLAAIEEARRLIGLGEIYQVNLSQIFSSAQTIDPQQLLFANHLVNPSRLSAFVALPDIERWIISASPERFFEKRGNQILCSPIKGTRPRGKKSEDDVALIAELSESQKENAELSMIVDLVRNDLSRIAREGTVRVAQHARVETLPHLHHLVSDVRAQLNPRYDLLDIFKALFPCGSITGAPKIAAMKAIAAIERTRRGIYTGAIGCFGAEDALFNVAIRTATITPTQILFQTGAGIVWDSVPKLEFEETLLKAQGIIEALNLTPRVFESEDIPVQYDKTAHIARRLF